MIAQHIAYVAAVSRDVPMAAELLEIGLGMVRTDVAIPGRGAAIPVFAVGQSALALFSLGDPFVEGSDKSGIHHIALACDAPSDTAAVAKDIGIASVGDTHPSLGGGEAIRLSADATCGIRTRFATPLAIERGGSFIERFDHIGIATADNEASTRCFSEHLGFPVESRQTDAEVQIAIESFTSDRYGVVYHSRPPRQVGGGRVTFVTIGDTELELLEPLDLTLANIDKGTPGDTRQDMGALARFVANRGPGLHHVALKVPDTTAALERVRRAGGRTIDEVGRPGSRRAQIGFVHPTALGGVLIHFDAREDPLRDLRPGCLTDR